MADPVLLTAVTGPSVIVGWTWESRENPVEKVEAAGNPTMCTVAPGET